MAQGRSTKQQGEFDNQGRVKKEIRIKITTYSKTSPHCWSPDIEIYQDNERIAWAMYHLERVSAGVMSHRNIQSFSCSIDREGKIFKYV